MDWSSILGMFSGGGGKGGYSLDMSEHQSAKQRASASGGYVDLQGDDPFNVLFPGSMGAIGGGSGGSGGFEIPWWVWIVGLLIAGIGVIRASR